MASETEALHNEQQNDLQQATQVAPINPFAAAQRAPGGGAMVEVMSAREVAEVQAQMLIARRFPRDQVAAVDRIINAFTRPSLAEVAQYEYARGGSEVRGPSIRAAEAIAQQWGNISCGVRELEQRPARGEQPGESTVEAFAIDLETGFSDRRVFQVPHMRHTKTRSYRLEDPRDVYELIANQGARRKRACILAVIPSDVTETAMNQADVTLKASTEVTPELIKSMMQRFEALGVPKEAIEKKIQRHVDSITPAQVMNLKRIYTSIKDGMSNPVDWFELEAGTATVSGANAADKGSAALKSAARTAAAQTGGAATSTNATAKKEEPKKPANADGEFAPDLAYVCERLNKAKTEDERLEAVDLIKHLPTAKDKVDAEAVALAAKERIEAKAAAPSK